MVSFHREVRGWVQVQCGLSRVEGSVGLGIGWQSRLVLYAQGGQVLPGSQLCILQYCSSL